MNRSRLAFLTLALSFILTALACAAPTFGPTEPAASPTPLGDTLAFNIPTYAISLQPGDTVPGTRLHYVGREGDAFKVTIDGLEATKRVGDSFIWSGTLAPGVYANYNLRLAFTVLGSLPAAGSVEVIVFNPEPMEAEIATSITEAQAYFDKILVSYEIPVGRLIPGSTLVYKGLVEPETGQQTSALAELAGMSGYPFFALGDSLVWTGKLRNNVYIRYNLRITAVNETNLSVAGTAELWITAE